MSYCISVEVYVHILLSYIFLSTSLCSVSGSPVCNIIIYVQIVRKYVENNYKVA